jgi:hypothetical protein
MSGAEQLLASALKIHGRSSYGRGLVGCSVVDDRAIPDDWNINEENSNRGGNDDDANEK